MKYKNQFSEHYNDLLEGRYDCIDFRCEIKIEKVCISPGDLIFGDLDGVIIIPKKIEREVIENALSKASGEKMVRKEIENGMSSTDAFKKYGIL